VPETVVGTLGVKFFAGLRTHFNDLPALVHVYVIPLVFCTTPTFVHLPPLEAASTEDVAKTETGSRHKASTPRDFLRQIILKNLHP
jgi:hypothetical protein